MTKLLSKSKRTVRPDGGWRIASEPLLSTSVERFDFGPFQSGTDASDFVSDLRLKIGKVTIAWREACEHFLVERHCLRRVDRVHAILFIDGLPKHHAPAGVAPFEEIIESASAKDIANYAVNRSTLRNGHFSLSDGAVPRQINGSAAKKM